MTAKGYPKRGEVTAKSKTKLGILFLGRKRPGFDPEWGREVRGRVEDFLKESTYTVVVPETVVDDASLRRAVARCREAECEVLAALQTTMGDGRLAPVLGQLWDGPVVLWATPERPEGPMISSNSLVGTHVFAANLRQLGRPFEVVYGAPDEARLRRDLDDAIRVAATARRLRRSKVGLIGHHAPGFIDMHPDPFDLNRTLGAQMHHFGLQQFVDDTNAVAEDEVRADVERVLEMNLPFEGVTEEDLPVNSRYYLAMRRLIVEESLDALAIRCWPELPNVMGQWAYLAMVRLTTEGYPNAMEGDVDGALCCLIGESLGFGPGYLSDWLEHDEGTITLWHPGNAPLTMCDPVGTEYGPRLAKHFNVPKPLVVNADLKADEPVTLFRLWRCDGRYRMMAQDARTATPRRPLLGTNGLVKIPDRNVYEWFEDLCHAGMPHHLAVFPGHNAKLLRRFARQTNIDLVGP